MGKSLLALVVVGLFGVSSAMAQDSSAASQNAQQQPSYNQSTPTNPQQAPATPNAGNSGESSSTLPPSTQSAMSNGASQMSNGGEQMVEGCLIHEQTAYYVQPENGGARVQLSPSRSLDSYAGQHVQVTGHTGGAGDNATATASGGASDMGNMLTVTGVKTISATCSPANTPRQR